MLALEIDVALAERLRQDTWRDAVADEADFFQVMQRLLMDLVRG